MDSQPHLARQASIGDGEVSAELRDSLAQVQELVAGMTPGALTVYDANEGDGWPPRPLWCFKNEAYDSGDEPALQGSIHYGGKEDADAIAAAVNFLREHGPALLAMMGATPKRTD
jgi:hypothetical protein